MSTTCRLAIIPRASFIPPKLGSPVLEPHLCSTWLSSFALWCWYSQKYDNGTRVEQWESFTNSLVEDLMSSNHSDVTTVDDTNYTNGTTHLTCSEMSNSCQNIVWTLKHVVKYDFPQKCASSYEVCAYIYVQYKTAQVETWSHAASSARPGQRNVTPRDTHGRQVWDNGDGAILMSSLPGYEAVVYECPLNQMFGIST